jgi:NADH:ubiquinone oxidoreductase subunit 6 (subunit J)
LVIALATLVAAFLAMYMEETTHAIAFLAATMVGIAILYFSMNAQVAAIFQLAIGVGGVVALTLASEMIATRTGSTKSLRDRLLAATVLILLIVPIFLDADSNLPVAFLSPSAPRELWSARSVDTLAQGCMILITAITVAVILRGEKEGS